LGFSKVTLKNIMSAQAAAGAFSSEITGLPDGVTAIAGLGSGSCPGSVQQVGNQITPASVSEYPWCPFYTEEFQVNGVYGNDLFVWILGGYYQDAPVPGRTVTPGGPATAISDGRLYGGVLSANLGYSPFAVPVSGDAWEAALFGQGTFDLSRIVPGVRLTGGYRQTWDYTSQTTDTLSASLPSGNFVYGPLNPQSLSKTSGPSWLFSVDYRPIREVMLYLSLSHGYKPGGVNENLGLPASELPPGYATQYQPEDLDAAEVGLKTQFSYRGMSGLFNIDYYHYDYSNMQESLEAQVGPLAVAYASNVAAARLQGLEIEGQLAPTDYLLFAANYAYNDAHYTNYFASDPMGLASYGSSLCDPAHSLAPTAALPLGFCALNLANNPFPEMPTNHGSVTVRYQLPIEESLGKMYLMGIVEASSRVYFMPFAARTEQALSPFFSAATVRDFVSQAPYSIINAEFNWENVAGKRFDASLFVHNLTNKLYSTANIATGLVSIGVAPVTYAEPRTFGGTLTFHF
jgi:iron complex outermembrane receptor protein